MKKLKYIFIIILLIIITAGLRLVNLNKPDLTADELHYVTDTFRFFNHELYMPLRHHPYQHPKPNMGHPMLSMAIGATIFKISDVSVFTSRLTSNISGILTVFLFLLFIPELGLLVPLSSAFLYAILPLTVRYSRDAHLDSLFTFLVTLTIVCIWRFYHDQKKIWLIFCGISAGLAVSTKLNGLWILVIIPIYIFYLTYKRNLPFTVNLKNIFYNLLMIFIPIFIVFFLLNNPLAYLNGILNPSDPRGNLTSPQALDRLFNFPKNFLNSSLVFITPVIFISFIFSTLILFWKRNKINLFIFIWFLGTFIFTIIQQMGGSGPWGWQPMIPALILLTVLTLFQLLKNKFKFWYIFCIITMTPYTYLYGLYQQKLPMIAKAQYDRTVNEIYFQNVINYLNQIAPDKSKVYILPSADYPLFTIRKDISFSYTGNIQDYDILLTDNEKINENFYLYKKISGFEDNQKIDRFIYLKK